MLHLLTLTMSREFGMARTVAEENALDHKFQTFLEVKHPRDSTWRRIAVINLQHPYSEPILGITPTKTIYADDFARARRLLPLLSA